MEKWSAKDKKYILLPFNDPSLYKVATDFLTINLISFLLTPKDSQGNPLNVFTGEKEKILWHRWASQ